MASSYGDSLRMGSQTDVAAHTAINMDSTTAGGTTTGNTEADESSPITTIVVLRRRSSERWPQGSCRRRQCGTINPYKADSCD